MDKSLFGRTTAPTVECNSNNHLDEIEKDIRDLISKCGSLTAELDNLRNETEASTRKMLLDFIEVADAFENVFHSIGPKLEAADQQTRIWMTNFRTVYKVLLRALNSCGVTQIEAAIGMKANPHWHNVTEVVKQADREDETIVEEIRKGYLRQGKLLRPSDVKAVKNS